MSIEPPRMDISKVAPEAYRHLLQLEGLVGQRIEHRLLHLIKLRASQINGCTFCIAMHTGEALRDGDQAVRLTSLDAWQESHLYSDRERAALRWVEEITLIADEHASRDSFEGLATYFSTDEISWLTLAAALINTWNRLAIASRLQFPTKAPTPERQQTGAPA